MPLAAGVRLGPYEILAPLAAGAMGEVYRARDTRLDRSVAVKVLPSELSANPDSLRRFEREARAASALNHPNLAVVHDIGSCDSISYIAMELVEGQTLQALLHSGRLSLRRLLDIASQLASGLAAAHEAGIVHRDVKPGNVVVSRDGFVKILDFGLAKRMDSPGRLATASASTRTRPGTLLGTIEYMSPEQAASQTVDFRSDQFSLGVVLYEMVTGARPFRGGTDQETLDAIRDDEPPPLTRVRPEAPAPLGWLVQRCLAKRPEDRYSSTRDLANDLSDIRSHLAELEAPPRPRPSRHWPLTGLLAIAVLLLAVTSLWKPPSRAPAIRFTLDAPPGTTFNVEGSSPAPAAVSPDGRLLVFGARDASGQSLLWVRPLDTTESRPLPGTENATYPFWAPDGQSIGFFAGEQLKRVAATGGPPQALCAAPDGRGGTWNREGTIVFAPDSEGPLYRVDAGGGPTVAVTISATGRPDASHRWPQFLPDGRHFLYTLWNADSQAVRGAVHLGSLDSLEGSLLIPNAVGGTYAPPGYVLFARAAGNLMALPFDARRLRTRGEPAALAANVHMHRYRWNAEFTVSSNGVLAYRARPASISQLTWFDRTGRRLGTVGAVGDYGGIRLSPDERRCAVELRDEGSGTVDIWAVDLAQGIPTRLTSGPFSNDSPIWSPDGTRVVFVSNRKGRWDLYQTALSGGGPAELLLETDSDKVPLDWSARARSIVFTRIGPASTDKWEVWVFRPEDGRQEPFLQTGANTPEARLSPDTRWMAYSSDETGAREVYLTSFPVRESRRRVSPRGGSQPVWRRDGRQLFYVADDGALMAVDVPPDARSTAGAAHVLFQPGLTASPSDVALYDVASDGQRFLVNAELSGRRAAPLTVVVNWTAAIER